MSTIKETVKLHQPLLFEKLSKVFHDKSLSHAYIIQGSNTEEEKKCCVVHESRFIL